MPLLLVALALYVLPLHERAVLVYPREHALRPVFYTRHQRKLREQLGARYVIDVHDGVAGAEELFAIDLRGASVLVLSGHGDPFSIGLDGRGSRTLAAGDRERLERFLAQLAPGATIVLQSCETGRGFAWLVKEAAGPARRVIAAKGEIPRDGLTIDSVDPLEVRITCRDEKGRAWDCTVRL